MKNVYRKLSVAIISVLMLVSVCYGQACAITNATGLLKISTASTLEEGELVSSYNHFNGRSYASLGLGVLHGVEVTITSRVFSKSPDLIGNLKVLLLDEDRWPAVAVGLTASNNNANYYIVGSRQIGLPGLRGHFGLGTGRYSKGFAGISSVLNPVTVSSRAKGYALPLTTAVLEYDGRGLNTGVIMRFRPDLEGKLYVSDLQYFGLALRYTTFF